MPMCSAPLQLALKDEWVRIRPPYFDAPGALMAPLGDSSEPSNLPPITMVFCIVDGIKVGQSTSLW